jgi:hypothetical protein
MVRFLRGALLVVDRFFSQETEKIGAYLFVRWATPTSDWPKASEFGLSLNSSPVSNPHFWRKKTFKHSEMSASWPGFRAFWPLRRNFIYVKAGRTCSCYFCCPILQYFIYWSFARLWTRSQFGSSAVVPAVGSPWSTTIDTTTCSDDDVAPRFEPGPRVSV